MPGAATAAARAAEPYDEYAPRYTRSAPAPARAAATRTERRPVRQDGFAPRARRVSGPVAQAVAAPRRVSGPVARAVAAPRPAARPFAPLPAPAGPVRRPARAPQRTVAPGGALARPLAAIKALPDNRLLDRIVRGRAWIAILGVLLVAIVGTQVEVLKLGTDVGQSTALAAQLGARNALLRAQETNMSNPHRIMHLAERLGMREVGPTNITYLQAGAQGVVAQAIADIEPPSAGDFVGSSTEPAGAPITAGTTDPAANAAIASTTSTNPGVSDTTPSTDGSTNLTNPTVGDAGVGTTAGGASAGGGGSQTNSGSAPGTSTGGAGI